MLNPQIAYWRMRDFQRIKALSAPQLVKLKKMANNLQKLYEIAMFDAFWRLQKLANGKIKRIFTGSEQENSWIRVFYWFF